MFVYFNIKYTLMYSNIIIRYIYYFDIFEFPTKISIKCIKYNNVYIIYTYSY